MLKQLIPDPIKIEQITWNWHFFGFSQQIDICNDKYFMSINLLSANIVTQIRDKLINKINSIISKRTFLFANMNLYSVDLFSKLVQEINDQLFTTVKQAKIHGIDEIQSIPTDNLMAMCDSKSFMQQPTQLAEENKSVTSSKMNQSHRKRRFSTIARTQKSEMQFSKPLSTIFQNIREFEPLGSGQDEQQSRQIEAYRQMKKREFEQRAKKQAQEIKNRQRAPINLSIEDVMYDYDYKLTKLQKQKERKWKSVPFVSPSIKQDYDQKKKRKLMREMMSRNAPVNIKQKINITLKQLQAEREKQKKKRNYSKNNVQPQAENTIHLVKVNLQSHKEIEQAISVKQPGIKITIKQREYNLDKESTRGALTKITRRLSKSQYLQFKADEEKKRIIKNSHLRFTEKIKPKVEEVKTPILKEEAKPAVNENNSTQNTYKLSLSLDNKQSDRDKSRIFIHNVLGKAELIKQVKHRAYLVQPQEQSKQKRDSLSIVDKYNLLYVKYHGNPPQSTFQHVKEQLQKQAKEVQKIKQNTISFNSNRKQNSIRQNLIMSRKV